MAFSRMRAFERAFNISFIQINLGEEILLSSEAFNDSFIGTADGISFVPLDEMARYKLNQHIGKEVEVIVGEHYGRVKLSAISSEGLLYRIHLMSLRTLVDWREGF